MEQMSLSSYQFEKGDLNDITILYEDETYLKYNYTIGLAKKTNEQFYNYFAERTKPNPESYLTISQISKSFMKKSNLFMGTNEQIKWDKEINNENSQSIKCTIDTNKGMNVIYQETFSFEDMSSTIN